MLSPYTVLLDEDQTRRERAAEIELTGHGSVAKLVLGFVCLFIFTFSGQRRHHDQLEILLFLQS